MVDADKEFSLPDDSKAYLVSGRYGAYIKWNGENIALSKEEKENPESITIESILKHIEDQSNKKPTQKSRKK